MTILHVDSQHLLNLNLLPEDYLEDRRRTRTNRRHRKAGVLFLLIVGLCTWSHFERSRQIHEERDLALKSVGALSEQVESPAIVRAKLEKLEMRAALRTMLRLRSLPSQAFRLLQETRPPEVQFSTVKLTHTGGTAASVTIPINSTASVEKIGSGHQRDLEYLQKRARERQQEIRVEGETPHDLAVATFLKNLERHPLCADADLEYTNQIDDQQEGERRRFAILIRIHSPMKLFEINHGSVKSIAEGIPLHAPLFQSTTTTASAQGDYR